jgi:uncharacterized protein YqgC (DUF456 family)
LSGPPFAWLGILLFFFVSEAEIPIWILIVTALIAAVSMVLEWTIPAYGTKVFQGSKYGVRGSYIGMIAGIIFPIPMGYIVGPFVGAFIGELILDWKDYKRALKAAFGTFIGFLVGIIINFTFVLILSIVWGFYFFKWIF